MSQLLLLLDRQENNRLLSEWLATHYQVCFPTSDSGAEPQMLPQLDQPFDLCILDGLSLNRFWQWVQARREAEQPAFLPFLLLTSQKGVDRATRNLWQRVDDVITSPVKKVELRARVEVLLRSRQFSLELKAAHEKLQQAKAEVDEALRQEKELNELKSRFVSMVSHEFRNPLNAILLSAEILEHYGDRWSGEKKAEFFQRISKGVGKMTELLDDVLLIGKGEAGQTFNPTPIELVEFCRDLVAEMQPSPANQPKISFANRGENIEQAETASIYMDKNLLQQILNNLLSNAIKYSPQDSTVYFELACQNGEAVFQIKDKGIGIPLEDQQRLFEPFHRAKNVNNIPGTGLGLTIVKQSVDLHNGKICVLSQPGLGTTFEVVLPLNHQAKPDEATSGS